MQALRLVAPVKCHYSLELNDQTASDQNIHSILTDDDPIIPNNDAMLLRHEYARLAQLMCQRVLIDFFQKPWPERIGDDKRTADGER